MDLTKDELRLYVETLSGILKIIDNMSNPSVKKIRFALKNEFDDIIVRLGGKLKEPQNLIK